MMTTMMRRTVEAAQLGAKVIPRLVMMIMLVMMTMTMTVTTMMMMAMMMMTTPRPRAAVALQGLSQTCHRRCSLARGRMCREPGRRVTPMRAARWAADGVALPRSH